MFDFIVWPLRHVYEWWSLRQYQLKKDPYLMDLRLNGPLLKRFVGMVEVKGSNLKWCLTVWVADRCDDVTDRIFRSNVRRWF